MACKEPVYLPLVSDMWVGSKANGAARTWMITPNNRWSLGLGLQSILACLRVTSPDANFQINVKWEYSVDGCNWKQRSNALIVNAATADDFTGSLLRSAAPTEFTPFVRLVVVVDASAGSAEVGALISVWGYYQYNC